MKRTERLKRKRTNKAVHERTREEREPFLFGRLYLFIIIVLVGALIYLLFFSGIFNLNNINVNGYGNSKKIEEIVREVSENSIVKNNILFINTNNLEDIVLGDPRIKEINISKKLPNSILIEIKESTPEIIWSSAGDKFYVDGGGYIVEKGENNIMVTVYDGSNIETGIGERVASPTFIKFIKDLDTNFEPVTGVEIVKITIFDIMSDVHVLSSDGWTVYLDANKDPIKQLENLNRVLKEAGNDGKGLEYIDMRLDTRIYYK